jgi:hypothetical protein
MKLKNSKGESIEIPKEHEDSVRQMISSGDHDAVTEFINSLNKGVSSSEDLSKIKGVTDFKGPSHEEGGIALSENAEVEGNEFKYDFGGQLGSYIFPDPNRSDIGKAARKAVSRRSKRVDDKISNESIKAELSALAQMNELDRFNKGAATANPSLYKKGGCYADGGIPEIQNTLPTSGAFNGEPNIMSLDTMGAQPIGGAQEFSGGQNLTGDHWKYSSSPMDMTGTSKSKSSNEYAGVQYATQAANALGTITKGTLDTSERLPESQALGVPMDSVMSSVPVVGQFYALGNAANEPIKDWQSDAIARGNKEEATAATTISGIVDPMDGWTQNAQAYEDGVISEEQAAGNLVAQFFLPGYANNAVAQAYEKKKKDAATNALIDTRMNDRGANITDSVTMRDRGFGSQTRYKNGGKFMYSKGGSWNEPVDADPVWNGDTSELDNETNSYLNSLYSTAPVDSPMGPPDDRSLHQNPKKKIPYDRILNGLSGALLNNIGNFAYSSEGKDYDGVSYPMMHPELVDNQLALREARDAYATSLETAKQSGKLDLGALNTTATQAAKTTSGIRENINNINSQIRNSAKQQNIGTTIQAMQDTAANKGQAYSNYYDNLKEIGKNFAGSQLEQSRMSTDEMLKRYLMKTFEQEYSALQ